MKTAYLFIMITTGLLTSCEEEVSEPIIDNGIIGSWLVVSEKDKFNGYTFLEDEDGITTRWGLGTKSSIKINADYTFNINVDRVINPNTGPLASGVVIPPSTWRLNEEETTITFYSANEYVGRILRDTTRFQISIDKDDQLILENEKLLIKHRRIN